MRPEKVWRLGNSFALIYGAQAVQVLADMAAEKTLADSNADTGDLQCLSRVVSHIAAKAA